MYLTSGSAYSPCVVCRKRTFRSQAPKTAKYKLHIDQDPTPWLGRQYTEYERALLEGCPPQCRKFNRVQVGTMKFRTALMDNKFKTMQCYFRSFYVERVRAKGREKTPEQTDR